jgi:hypothetical protein
MTTEGQISNPLPAGKMLAFTAGAFVVASLIVFGAILPAEFNWDPLGLGRISGLDRLWAPKQVAYDPSGNSAPLAREYDRGFRTDTIEIPLRPDGDRRGGDELEYKVRMAKDATLLFEWSVADIPNPEEFYSEFHGHTTVDGQEMTVAFYRKATGTSANGALTAPFDGIHGWYFQNQSVNPVVVRVKLSGFYDLIPLGEAGNEARILANVPADRAIVAK